MATPAVSGGASSLDALVRPSWKLTKAGQAFFVGSPADSSVGAPDSNGKIVLRKAPFSLSIAMSLGAPEEPEEVEV